MTTDWPHRTIDNADDQDQVMLCPRPRKRHQANQFAYVLEILAG